MMTNKAFVLAAPFTIGFASLGLTAASPALACNPDAGCGGMTAEELEADAAEIRRLNNEQLRYVEQRDAEYAKGWTARREHKAAVAEYERRMAAWREAVKRCEAGDTRYCAPR
jgi:hypothetical protein